jgi:lipopolysaccharide biosynthesis regulator YciM
MVNSGQWAVKTNKKTEKVTLYVSYLEGNPNRAKTLQDRLERVLGIERAYVSHTTEMVYIVYDPIRINVQAIQQKLQKLEVELG